MSELLPCPFCGSGWLYEISRNDYYDYTPAMFCNSCKAVVTWEQVEEEGVNDKTTAFVRKHWNSRAERTCHNVDDHKTVWFICSVCGCSQTLSHTRSYCPNCGAKVVGE